MRSQVLDYQYTMVKIMSRKQYNLYYLKRARANILLKRIYKYFLNLIIPYIEAYVSLSFMKKGFKK